MSDFAKRLAEEYAELPEVEAVALSGSRTGPFAQPSSDFDLYVYSHAPVQLEARRKIATRRAQHAEVGNDIWEPGDEWVETSGERIDVMFRACSWIEEQLARVLDRHEASVGYSTAFWFNVRNSQVLFDRRGWFASLQARAHAPYPDDLRRNIVAKNYLILRNTQSSYAEQIAKALDRRDSVSVNHRVSALLASFFDILFALNREPHPGEKRLLLWSAELCAKRPADLDTLVPSLIAAAGDADPSTLKWMGQLLDELDHLLRTEQLI